MGAIKQSAPFSASPSAGFSAGKSASNPPLARDVTARPLSPSEFAGLLRESHGIAVSERWVQRQCALGRIAFIRLPYYARRLIPASEAARFAACVAQACTTEAAR